MDKDSGSLFHHNSLGSSYDVGWPNNNPARRKLYSVEYPALTIDPFVQLSEMQQSEASKLNGSHAPNSFHLWHQLHPAFSPVLNSASEEKFLAGAIHCGQKRRPINCVAPAQKRFLVFDQSGDKTTLVYSSLIENSIRYGACLVPKPPPSTYNNQIDEEPMNSLCPLEPIMNDERIEDNSRDGTEDEIREDTEELNALLCSDSDSDYLKDDEETSTGRSPSTMTDSRMVEETGDEASSFTGPMKRRKLLDGNYNMPSQRRTSCSSKTYACTALEDEAECTARNKISAEEIGPLSCIKRKERIQETLSMLQSIFPSVCGNDPVAFIDKTIQYLRLLKVEAKALGLDSH